MQTRIEATQLQFGTLFVPVLVLVVKKKKEEEEWIQMEEQRTGRKTVGDMQASVSVAFVFVDRERIVPSLFVAVAPVETVVEWIVFAFDVGCLKRQK